MTTLDAPVDPLPPAPRAIGPLAFLGVSAICLFAQLAGFVAWIVVMGVRSGMSHVAFDSTAHPGAKTLAILQVNDTVLSLGLAWLAACWWTKQSAGEGLAIRRVPARWLLIAGTLGFGCFSMASLILQFFPGPENSFMKDLATSPAMRHVFLVLGSLSPFFEEVYYRGFMFRALENRFGVRVSAIVVAVWFAAVHAPQYWPNIGAMLSIALIATTTSVLRAKSGSIVPGIVAHGAYNWPQILGALLAGAGN